MKDLLTGKVPFFLTQEKALKKILQERERGDLRKARKTSIEALEKWPDDYDLAIESAQSCLDLSDYPQAANILKNAHKRHADRRGEIMELAHAAFMHSFSTLLGSVIIEILLKSRNLEGITDLLQASPESFGADLTKRGETRSKNLSSEGQDGSALYAENEMLLGILYGEGKHFEKAVESLGRSIEILPGDAQAIGTLLAHIEQELPENALVKFYLGLASSLLERPEKAETRFFQCLEMKAPPLEKIMSAIESANKPCEHREIIRGEVLLRSGKLREGASVIRASLWNAAAPAPEGIAGAAPRDGGMELAERRLAALPEPLFAEREIIFLYCDVAAALGLMKETVGVLERSIAANAADLPAITEWLEKHEEASPTAPAQNLLAAIHIESGEFDKGVRAARLAADASSAFIPGIIENIRNRMERSPDVDPKLKAFLCELYARSGDRESAEEVYGALRRKGDLGNEELMKLSGDIMRHCGTFLTGVIAALEVCLRNKNIDEAIPYVVAFYKEKPELHGEFASSIGELAEENEEYRHAIAELIDFMAKEENLSQPFRYLQATAHLFTGEVERSVFEFDRQLATNADLRQPIIGLYTKALARFETNPTLHLALYHLYLDEESLVEASHHLCRTLELDPNQIRDVIARFEKLVEREPGNLGIWEEMLTTALAMNRTSLAKEVLTRAIAALPRERSAALHVYGARISAADGKWDDALRCIALTLAAPEVDVRTIEGEIRSIMQRDPANPLAHFLLGEALIRIGKEREAVSVLRRCLDLSATFRKPVREKLEKLLPLSVEPWLLSVILGEIAWLEGFQDDAFRAFADAQKGPRESLAQLGASLERIRSSAPGDARLALLHARNLSLEGRFAEAVSILDDLIARDADLTRLATDILISIITERPGQCDANRLLAQIFVRAGDVERSRQPVIRIMSDETADPSHLDAIVSEFLPHHETNGEFLVCYAGLKARRGEMAEALARYRAAFAIDPALSSAVLAAVGKHLWPNEFLDAERLLSIDCLIAEHRTNEAFSLLAAGSAHDGPTAAEIMARLSKLIEEAPRREQFSFGASLLALSGRLAEAESLIARGCSVLGADDSLDLTIELGEILHNAGDTERADRIFAEALESSSASAAVFKRIERACTQRIEDEIRSLAERFEGGRASDAEIVRLVNLALESGSPARALDILSRSPLALTPRSELLGRIYLCMDRPALACAALAAAGKSGFASETEKRDHRYLEGIARERSGDFGRAAANFAAIAGEHGDHEDSRNRALLNYTRFLAERCEERPMVLEKTDVI